MTTGTPGSAGSAGTAGTTGTQAVDRAAHLLALVVRARGAVPFTTLATEAGYARSTTSRLLSALERSDLLARDDTGAFLPGPLFDVYAARAGRDDDLARLAEPTMATLSELTGETINLGVPRGGTVIHAAQVAATYILGSRDWVGVEVPPHVSALGKVLYAHGALDLPTGRLTRPTDASPRSVTALRTQLTGIRSKGYAVTVDELEVGLTGIAAPIFNGSQAVAALGLSGPTARLATQADILGPVVAHHAARLSRQITRHRKDGAA